MRKILFLFFSCMPLLLYAGDSSYLKVHFLYGSRPLKKYKDTEKKWFGGKLGGQPDSAKKAIVYIPVTPRQKQQFDSITTAYLAQTPYDYALFGMRCGAATYEVLGQLDILPRYKNSKTCKKIFYPKKLRKRLFKKAGNNGWLIERQPGSGRRKWERD